MVYLSKNILGVVMVSGFLSCLMPIAASGSVTKFSADDYSGMCSFFQSTSPMSFTAKEVSCGSGKLAYVVDSSKSILVFCSTLGTAAVVSDLPVSGDCGDY